MFTVSLVSFLFHYDTLPLSHLSTFCTLFLFLISPPSFGLPSFLLFPGLILGYTYTVHQKWFYLLSLSLEDTAQKDLKEILAEVLVRMVASEQYLYLKKELWETQNFDPKEWIPSSRLLSTITNHGCQIFRAELPSPILLITQFASCISRVTYVYNCLCPLDESTLRHYKVSFLVVSSNFCLKSNLSDISIATPSFLVAVSTVFFFHIFTFNLFVLWI